MEYQDKCHIQVTSYKLESTEGVIQSQVYVPRTAKFPVILFFAGFPGYQRNLDLAVELALSGFATCTFDYPGTWGSKGKFSPLIGVKVAEEVREFILEILSPEVNQWGIFGHSWGATLALLYGAQDPSCKSIAVLSPVNDLLSITEGTRESVAQMFIDDAAPLKIEVDYDKLEADLNIIASQNILKDTIQQITQPVLLMHGSNDQEVPSSQSQQIAELAGDKFMLRALPDEGHNPKNREKLVSNLLEWYNNTMR